MDDTDKRTMNQLLGAVGQLGATQAASGVLSLLDVQTTTPEAYAPPAASTWYDIPGYTYSFTSHGGLVDIRASFSCGATNLTNSAAAIGLLLDGVMKAQKVSWVDQEVGFGSLVFFHRAILKSGSHTLKFQYKMSSASAALALNRSDLAGATTSEISVVEFNFNQVAL